MKYNLDCEEIASTHCGLSGTVAMAGICGARSLLIVASPAILVARDTIEAEQL